MPSDPDLILEVERADAGVFDEHAGVGLTDSAGAEVCRPPEFLDGGHRLGDRCALRRTDV